jgi:hypothetical protein
MKDKFLEIIEDELIGINSIPAKLRNEHFFDKESFEKLINALEIAIEAFKGQIQVPKRLALCFIDISNHFFVDDNFFSQDEIELIEDAGITLSELANKLFDDE